ncbi:Glutathione transferase [Alteripontixanthobacter maritimus]|uniref:Glutathione transferase n=1 Tax=Alteripontixanthobacter maritimus TaxID=2161824 RepID=A0A369Q2Q0_9SPHN|nr:glutathione S-transferase family protein [Alteripontixanthobacter maritimus]RDC59044.1 Glutathione transferase [Alteripontixanthobacter maritimus]
MWRLFHFPLCPFSRKVRLLLSEKGVPYELQRVEPWSAGDEFYALNPAGRTPVLHDAEKNRTLCDSRAICEYFEETVEQAPMINGTAVNRAEIRRLTALFDENFYGDVTAPLMHERMKKRLFLREPPNSGILREAMKNAHAHLDYIDWLIDTRAWLAGPTKSMADLAAAAQISVADYLGGIDWAGHEQSRDWYFTFKCRPSFRPLLAEKMEGIHPPAHYAQLDVD